MRNSWLCLCLCLNLLATSLSADELPKVLVIANVAPAPELSSNELRNIFLGQRGAGYVPVVPPPKTGARIVFNTRVMGLSEARIQSFYAQMRFSNRAEPPQQFESDQALIDYVSKTPGAISYVTAPADLPQHVVVVAMVSS